MIGSFAYIGVTFFFMASGYGLTFAYNNDKNTINTFWRRRLPKILIPSLLVNVFFSFAYLVLCKKELTVLGFIQLNEWVYWLLICYLIFGLTHFKRQFHYSMLLNLVVVVIFSVVTFIMGKTGLISSGNWSVECLGFAWGGLIVNYKKELYDWAKSYWLRKIFILSFVVGFVGVLYLKLKPVVFIGDYVIKSVLAILFLGLLLLVNVRYSIGNKICRYLGEISFEIFLSHISVIRIMKILELPMSSGVFILCAIIISVMIGSVIHYLCRYLLKCVENIVQWQKEH